MSRRWHQKKAHGNSFRFCRCPASSVLARWGAGTGLFRTSQGPVLDVLSRLVASCHSLWTRLYLSFCMTTYSKTKEKTIWKDIDRPSTQTYQRECRETDQSLSHTGIHRRALAVLGLPYLYCCIMLHHVASCCIMLHVSSICSDSIRFVAFYHYVSLLYLLRPSPTGGQGEASTACFPPLGITDGVIMSDPSSHEESQHVNFQVERHMRHGWINVELRGLRGWFICWWDVSKKWSHLKCWILWGSRPHHGHVGRWCCLASSLQETRGKAVESFAVTWNVLTWLIWTYLNSCSGQLPLFLSWTHYIVDWALFWCCSWNCSFYLFPFDQSKPLLLAATWFWRQVWSVRLRPIYSFEHPTCGKRACW